jgi:hypothetical protein
MDNPVLRIDIKGLALANSVQPVKKKTARQPA